MIESNQLGWRVHSALDGQQPELRQPPLDDPQFASLLLRVQAASDALGLLSIFRSILGEVVSNGFPDEQIAVLRRLHPHVEMAEQRLLAHEDRAAETEGRARGEFASIAARPSLQESFNRLTRAEGALVERLWAGASNKEIATDLGKGVRTVKSQLTSVYKKFGVKSRSKLLALMR